jgi:hypothetical protein
MHTPPDPLKLKSWKRSNKPRLVRFLVNLKKGKKSRLRLNMAQPLKMVRRWLQPLHGHHQILRLAQPSLELRHLPALCITLFVLEYLIPYLLSVLADIQKFESQMSLESSTAPTISRLPPITYVDTELPIPCISWLSRIHDYKRLRFGFAYGILRHLQIEAPNYELPSDSPGFEILHRSEISASFQVADQIGSKYFPTRYFVRDNDLWGNNRLYGRNSIKIYHDGEYTHSDTPTMENNISR